jgi:thiamine biosynthesis lipoprotein
MSLGGIILPILVLLILVYSQLSYGKWFEDIQGFMGTNIHVELWSDSAQQGDAAIQAVLHEMQRINLLMSPIFEAVN